MGEKKVWRAMNRRPARPSKWTASERDNRGGDEMERNIKNSFKLLSDIVKGLNEITNYETHLVQIFVKFYEDDKLVAQFSLIKTLEVIAKDLHYDKFCNWSEANRATVHGG